MTLNGYLQLGLFGLIVLALVRPVGLYMARVYEGKPIGIDRVLGPLERVFYRLAGVRAESEMSWRTYAFAALIFNVLGVLVVYFLQRAQASLPLNPQLLGAVTPDSSFNTAISFVTNTNWQGYGGEVTMGYLTQMLGLTVQNFVSAATGMAVLVALVRGLARREANTIGNFWVDMTRSTLYILLPLALILALALVSQGVVQTFDGARTVTLVEPQALTADDGTTTTISEQTIPLGPAASQVAIKQLGSNGGGFYNVNSAHPLENPTPLSNLLQVLGIILLPAAFCLTFGRMVGDMRQGWAVFAAMTLILVPLLAVTVGAEQAGTPQLSAAGANLMASDTQPGGNMEGKEARFGIVNSALWAVITTATSNGAVNSMHDSFTPLGGFAPMWLMQLGEVVFGGIGSGLYGLLVFVIITVFVAGLMVGRAPEYLGKKVEVYEMKMASLAILLPTVVVLGCTALAVALPEGRGALYEAGVAYTSIYNPGAHGFSEVLYAFSSMANNNGSAFAGLGAKIRFTTCWARWRCGSPALARWYWCWRSAARWRAKKQRSPAPVRCPRTRRCLSCC